MYPNINAGLGQLMANALNSTITSGRFYVVCGTSIANYQEINGVYGTQVYPDGTAVLYTTVAAAVAACRAGAGDQILVVPGHTETLTSATSLNINVASVRVIGLGLGNDRPNLTLATAAAATVTISAANVEFQNIIITATGVASVTAAMNITAAGAMINNCKFILANGTNQAVLGILTTSAAAQLTVQNSYFVGSANAGTATAIRLVGGSDIFIINNTFFGNYTTTLGAIQNVTTAVAQLYCIGNVIANNTASSTVAITVVSSTTGNLANNRIQILSGTAPFVAAAMSWVGGNYYAAAAAGAGTLI